MTAEILSEKNAVLAMLVDAQNALTKSEITERLFQRANIKNQLDKQAMQRMGQNQEIIKQTKFMVADLKEFYKTASEANPLADIVK